MRRLLSPRAISRLGPLVKFGLRAWMGARLRAFETIRDRAVAFTGRKQDLGTLICHHLISNLRIRCRRRIYKLPTCPLAFRNPSNLLAGAFRAAVGVESNDITPCAREPFASLPDRGPKRQTCCWGI